MMNIGQLRVLDALERERSFSKAASFLGISQPAVSMQMRKLQGTHGVKLFWRHGKAVQFSTIGKDLVLKARKVISIVDDIESILDSASQLKKGSLSVGMSCNYLVMEVLAAFMNRYPEIQVKARVDDSMNLLDEVLACRLDIAEITGSLPDPRVHCSLYGNQEIVLFVGRGHEWAGTQSLQIPALHDQRMVALHPTSMTRQIFMARLKTFGVVPDIVLELDSWETLRDAVVEGIGFGIALEDEYTTDERLFKIRIDGTDMRASQYFICLPEFRRLRTVSAFFDLLESVRPSTPEGNHPSAVYP
ncbi:MAG: LysR family transcriptional regulator [Pseudomonadota bacterium]